MSEQYKAPQWVFGILEILLEYKEQWEDLGCDNRGECLEEGPCDAQLMIFPVTFSCVQYERAPFLPHNFVAIGDSWMRVNPVYA